MPDELINNLTRIDTLNLNALELLRHPDLHIICGARSYWVLECYRFLEFPDELPVGKVNINVAVTLAPFFFGSSSTFIQDVFSRKYDYARNLGINLRVPKKINEAETALLQRKSDDLCRETGHCYKVISDGFVDIPFLYDYINVCDKYYRYADMEFITSMQDDEVTVKLTNSGISYHIKLV